MEPTPLEKAISIVGSHKLAKKVGVKPPTVYSWLRTGRAPAERCIAIEQATGGAVTRYELRPDVFCEAPIPPSNQSPQTQHVA